MSGDMLTSAINSATGAIKPVGQAMTGFNQAAAPIGSAASGALTGANQLAQLLGMGGSPQNQGHPPLNIPGAAGGQITPAMPAPGNPIQTPAMAGVPQPGAAANPMMAMPAPGPFPGAPGQPPPPSPQRMNPGSSPDTLAMLQIMKLLGVG